VLGYVGQYAQQLLLLQSMQPPVPQVLHGTGL
jgi:hypothetical protein